ncbi:hypothetical protein [Thermoflexibacter ruber]|uniref:Uncharacterized protein n=1 Tax=Thermoflexibacter ruber TaxID=1003 RepID=A0A1I2HQQ9_9BACT|nr:hypothetical protein [Thermoflexibacter ruber]SFF32022.1 hypothetical protein SAMN04488541_102566 [Thermoflexibacter ruber]
MLLHFHHPKQLVPALRPLIISQVIRLHIQVIVKQSIDFPLGYRCRCTLQQLKADAPTTPKDQIPQVNPDKPLFANNAGISGKAFIDKHTLFYRYGQCAGKQAGRNGKRKVPKPNPPKSRK